MRISAQNWPLVLKFFFFFTLQTQEFSVGDFGFSCDTHISSQGLPFSLQPPPLSLFLQYSCWNINGHIFVCCWDIWYIPHTSWYSVLLSQSTWSTISSHQFSKLTIFISVFRIFSQPVFLFLLYQSLNDQYQQPCTNNFSLIFLTDEQTDKQTNKQTNIYFNYKTNWFPELTKKLLNYVTMSSDVHQVAILSVPAKATIWIL